jgi:hypothetical protein
MSVKMKANLGRLVSGAMLAMPTFAQATLWHCSCNPSVCVCVKVY